MYQPIGVLVALTIYTSAGFISLVKLFNSHSRQSSRSSARLKCHRTWQSTGLYILPLDGINFIQRRGQGSKSLPIHLPIYQHGELQVFTYLWFNRSHNHGCYFRRKSSKIHVYSCKPFTSKYCRNYLNQIWAPLFSIFVFTLRSVQNGRRHVFYVRMSK